ncbi:uncharacterized protein LOC117933477 isoform X4 [Vitis riparia]|uniref:uncharacterized protein LOC117933477 isoform X4 n=1 Tax=Vitis riparia TaxID=96939 RepID=UPI00155A18BD|nr:uncharacterized protein LOC117933477 isoform X4 [Vitis riparia]
MEISGQVSYDVAATYAWKLYEAFQLAKIIQKGFSHMVEKVELIENDGGVGTILELTSVGGQGTGSVPMASGKHRAGPNIFVISHCWVPLHMLGGVFSIA